MGKKNASPVERISLCRSRSHANSCPFPCHLRIFTAFPCSRRKGSRRDWKEDSPVRESRKVRMLSVTFPPQKRATGKDAPARLKKAPSLAVVFQISGNAHTGKRKFSRRKGFLSVLTALPREGSAYDLHFFSLPGSLP